MQPSNPILFFNGCSFVHGHTLLTDFPGELSISNRIGKELNLQTVNLGSYGATNDLIALSTIDYFNKLSPEDRSNHIACIGWSEPSRTLVPDPFSNRDDEYVEGDNYSNLRKLWLQLNIHVFQDADIEIQNKFKNLVKEMIMTLGDDYWFKEHIKNILLLQNYFEANNIGYVFWNSIGMPLSDVDSKIVDMFVDLVDWTHWINWDELKLKYMYPRLPNYAEEFKHPYDFKYGILGAMMFSDPKNISIWTRSGHPGPNLAQAWSTVIIKHLKSKTLVTN